MFENVNIIPNNDYYINIKKYKDMIKGKERPYTFGYARLSREDTKDRNSLPNQKGIIRDYAERQGFDIVDIIEDDGISGMTFDRDGIALLKDLIDEGLVDIILVKDLSRLGRHKAYSALFIEYANSHNVKIISATENIDTTNENDDILIGFKQIINEQYSKDLSRKIRAGFKQKQKEEGLVIIPPFGYYKNKKGEIEIFEESAEVVRYIFKIYTEENIGTKKIANRLTEEGYKTPATYHKILYGKNYNRTTKAYIWHDKTVSQILKNDSYIGTLRCNVTYKNRITNIRKELPPEEHIVHESFYPPIVDKETWDLAQAIRENRSKNNIRASNNSKIHRYAGLLKCGDCNSGFVAKRRKLKSEERIEYTCNNYHRRGSNVCSSHRIREEELDDIVYSYLDRLKVLAEENLLKVDEFIKEWNNKKRDYDKDIDKLNLEIMQLKEDVKQYAQQLARKLISEEIFKELTKDTEIRIEYLGKQIKTLKEMIEINKDAKRGIESSVNLLTDIVNNKELSDAHLQMLVNKIIISEDKEGKLSLDIILNTPFAYHESLAGYFTEEMSS
ncbi:recombinase family protein [Tissierella praeacuta]|uniref:recombinase family protein n=1 Tax=Tissierella praeacuta TaxID=43131 RepID=UPI0035198FE8